jgi:hypothetical protein
MDPRRLWFLVALLTFVIWITSLAVLASLAGRRPARSPAVAGPLLSGPGPRPCDAPSEQDPYSRECPSPAGGVMG